MNRRENYVVSKIDGDAARSARRNAMRDIALDVVASAMCDVLEPSDRDELARELVTASAMNSFAARGSTPTGAHLASLSGQVFRAGEQIHQQQKRRGR